MYSNWFAFFVPLLLLWICWPLAFAPPSARVKELAMDPARKIEAMRVYRQETGADRRRQRP